MSGRRRQGRPGSRLVPLGLLLAWSAASHGAEGGYLDAENQAPRVDLSHYESPEGRAGAQRTDLSVVVAISGGGHRAANFGVGVLRALESLACEEGGFDALREVDYLSTVSGGGFAAGAYVAALQDHLAAGGDREGFSLRAALEGANGAVDPDLKRNLERGYRNVLVRAVVNLRSLGNFDRGDYLEDALDRRVLGREHRGRSLQLGDVLVRRERGERARLPIWIANAAVYENGAIFPFTQEILRRYEVSGYTHGVAKVSIEPPRTREAYDSVPLALGMTASATFPGAVPAATLASEAGGDARFIHLFDGGLADNLGILTGVNLLLQTQTPHRVLILIDAYAGSSEPFSRSEGSPTIPEIVARSTGISLDSWRTRHRWVAGGLASAAGPESPQVVYLSFDPLPAEVRARARRIATDFELNVEEQQALFAAGEMAVAEQTARLCSALGR